MALFEFSHDKITEAHHRAKPLNTVDAFFTG
jgi:hypothetical protein